MRGLTGSRRVPSGSQSSHCRKRGLTRGMSGSSAHRYGITVHHTHTHVAWTPSWHTHSCLSRARPVLCGRFDACVSIPRYRRVEYR
eukprot:4045952-Prymnesium_polylepis.1